MNLRYALYAAVVGFMFLVGPPALLLLADALGFMLFMTWGLVMTSLILSVGMMALRR